MCLLKTMYVNNLESNCPKLVVLLDEIWIYSKGNKGKSWQDDFVKSERKPKGYDGKCFVTLYAGTESGLINSVNFIFASNNKLGEYHASINSMKFQQWITTQLLPNEPKKSPIIIDNAPDYSDIINKVPNILSRKQVIMYWLNVNSIDFSSAFTIYQLLDLVKQNKPEKKYTVDELIKAHGHDVFKLPPYHCVFNVIVLIWVSAKGYYKHIRLCYRDLNLSMWKRWNIVAKILGKIVYSTQII